MKFDQIQIKPLSADKMITLLSHKIKHDKKIAKENDDLITVTTDDSFANEIMRNHEWLTQAGWVIADLYQHDHYPEDLRHYSTLRLEPFISSTVNVPKFLYHISPIKNIQSIMTYGLIPQRGDRTGQVFSIPDRVFMASSYNAAIRIAQLFNEELYNPLEFAVFKIDTEKLPGRIFHIDPQFNNGVYTTDVIPPSAITVIGNYPNVKSSVSESITNIPLDLKKWAMARSKQIGLIVDILKKANDVIMSTSYDVTDDLNAIAQNIDSAIMFDDMGRYINKMVDSGYDLPILKETLKNFALHGDTFSKYLLSNIEANNDYEFNENINIILDKIDKIKENIPGKVHDENLTQALNLIEVYELLKKVRVNLRNLIKDIKIKISLVTDISHTGLHSYRPEHTEEEKMYHVSAFASEISKNGFGAEPPVDRTGVGNYGRIKEISMTHNYTIAQGILRTFNELWKIVHDVLSLDTIKLWFVAEDIPFPSSTDVEMSQDHIKYNIDVYQFYLSNSKKRYNPMIVNIDKLAEILKYRKLSDIGILQCQVNMTGKEEYLWSEQEFRILPNQVNAVKRII